VDYPNLIYAAGDVYFTDINNDVIRRVDGVSSAPIALGAGAGLVDPQGLLVLSEIDPFDFDNDGDVDGSDTGVALNAINGPDVMTPPDGTSLTNFLRTDVDGDKDVDMKDVWVFMRRVTN
jgi:hypothetical protein